MAAITEDVKSTAFTNLTKFNQTLGFDEGGIVFVPATLENEKENVQRHDEQETFCGWFWRRCCRCDDDGQWGYWGTGDSSTSHDSGGDCCTCGDCCGDCLGCDCFWCVCGDCDCGEG